MSFIFGWKAQRTSTVPASLKVTLDALPGNCTFELNSLPFDVENALCVTSSSFLKVSVSPALTVSVAGREGFALLAHRVRGGLDTDDRGGERASGGEKRMTEHGHGEPL